MSGMGLGLVVESLVTVLLGVTVAYCILLDKRLRSFKADESGMRQTVVELALATERAEKAISGLRTIITEADGSLTQRLRSAEAFTKELDGKLQSGDAVLSRIMKIVATAKLAATESSEPPKFAAQQRETEETRAIRLAETLATARAMAERSQQRRFDLQPQA
jgi:hypothetical protein